MTVLKIAKTVTAAAFALGLAAVFAGRR